jgi:hypothetical protein
MFIGLFQTPAEGGKFIVIPFGFDDAFSGIPVTGLTIDTCCERRTFAVYTDSAHNGCCAIGFYFIPVDVE